MNSLLGRVVLLEFICNLCNEILLNFKIMKLLRDVKVNVEALPTKLMLCRVDYKGESTSITYSFKMMHILSLGECNLSELEIA